MKMTLIELRYCFEHEILPKYFFEDTEPFLTEMLDALDNEEGFDNSVIYEMVMDIAKKKIILSGFICRSRKNLYYVLIYICCFP